MKLLIVALDGLDVNHILKWSFYGLLQEYWGRHYVGFLRYLYTPIVWSCFLTGLNVEEMGYDMNSLTDKRRREAFHPLLRPLYLLRKKLLPPGVSLHIRPFLTRLGLMNVYAPSIMPEELRGRTFLEFLKARGLKVKAIEIPGYNERRNEYFRTIWIHYATANLREKKRIARLCLAECERRLSTALDLLSRHDLDLLMVYFPMPDIAHHLFFKGIRELVQLHRAYWLAEGWVKKLKEAAGPGYACLVVSDHGFIRSERTHSDHGFWSLNVKPPFKPSRITDFYRLVVKLVLYRP